jgi:hypothetical protein
MSSAAGTAGTVSAAGTAGTVSAAGDDSTVGEFRISYGMAAVRIPKLYCFKARSFAPALPDTAPLAP